MTTELGLHIHITGEKGAGKTLVSNIVKEALDKKGFENVTLIEHSGEPVASYEPQTILDIVKLKNPSFFKMPITIGESTVRDTVDLSELDNAKVYQVITAPTLVETIETTEVEFNDIPY